ncbi:MAG: response regulator receiver [Bacteroidetes bacterium]|nr:response regulator receiver [Bacteroidota bacterium]
MKSHQTTDASPPARDQISLWVIEDDELFRKTLVGFLNSTPGMRCERDFSSCEDALEVLRKEFAPEVVLMDIQLPGMNGIEGLRQIKSISPATDIIMLTIFEEEDKIFRAICAGANGYLLKSSPSEEIIRAIQEVLEGGAPMNAQIARRVLDMFSDLAMPKGDYNLTDREKEILRYLTEGLTKRHIAEKIFLSHYTIDTHVKNIYAKLQVHTRTGAVAKVLKEHLLSAMILMAFSLLPTMS